MASRFRSISIAIVFLMTIGSTEIAHSQLWPFAIGARPAAPAPLACLGTSNPNERTVENQLVNPARGSFAWAWRQPATLANYTRACQAERLAAQRAVAPINNGNLGVARTVAAFHQAGLSRACIRAAIVSRANDNIPLNRVNRKVCTPTMRELDTTPCMTENYVNYTHFTINSAVRCMSSPGNEINPDLLFGMINNESAFMGFVQYSGGVGLMQLTSVAAREVFNDGQAGRAHLDEMMSRPQKRAFCDPFRHLISEVPERADLNNCAWFGMNNGVPRNVIAGVALLSFYLKTMKEHIESKGISRSHRNFQLIAEQLALVAYNAGPNAARLVLDKLGAGATARSSDPALLIRNGATRWARNTYLTDIRSHAADVPNRPASCWETP